MTKEIVEVVVEGEDDAEMETTVAAEQEGEEIDAEHHRMESVV